MTVDELQVLITANTTALKKEIAVLSQECSLNVKYPTRTERQRSVS